MANVSLDTDGDIVYRRRRDARTLEEHVHKWAARRMLAGLPARRCVLPFLTGAPKAVECHVCFRIIYAGEEIKCSINCCQKMFHLNCVVEDTSNFTSVNFRCPQHGCMVCKQKESFWRCRRCTVAAHTKCAPWPMIDLKDDHAICWRHASDWLLQNKKANFTNSIEEVFCRLPLPYVNEDFDVDSTIRDFAATVCKPPPSTAISREDVYLSKKKHTGVCVDTGCTNCMADSTCKEDCECRNLHKIHICHFIRKSVTICYYIQSWIHGISDKKKNKQDDGETRAGVFASCSIKVGEPLTYDFRHKDKSLPSIHPLDLICEAIGRSPHDASVGARHVASIGEEQSNMNSPQKMDIGRQGLDYQLEQDLHAESLNVSANDADQQAQTSEHVTDRPLTRAEMPCVAEAGSVHPECRSTQANVNEKEANQGKDYSISRCLDVLEAMDDVPDEIKILASDVFRDATNREMFLCYAPRLRGLWLKKELGKLHGPHLVND